MNDATKYVCSRSRPSLDWGPAVLIEGDAAEGVAALKQGDGRELQVHGSGNPAQTLIRHSLVDSKVSTTGVVMGTYERASRPYGLVLALG